MDIFNKKRIADLEKKLHETERERDKYISKSAELASKIEEIGELTETIPEGCQKGPWCKACEFSRTFHYTVYYYPYGGHSTETIYVCSRGKSCENFVQKGD